MNERRIARSSDQKDHYERIHDDYERHYYDAPSMAFRRRFIYDVMLNGMDLDGFAIADLASGSGHNSLALRERYPDARFTGFDISAKACRDYEANVGAEAHEMDITRGYRGAAEFDVAVIFGGLHHCVADLPGALATVAAMLRPGGRFLMFEPNSRYVLEGMRRLWYRFDRYFEAGTEAALDHDALLATAGGAFRAEDVRHLGGPAYFLIYNSLVFRIPPKAKAFIAKPLMATESLYNKLPGRVFFPYFIARWRRV